MKTLLRHPLLLTLLLAAVAVGAIFAFVSGSLPAEPRQRARALLEAGLADQARPLLEELLLKAPRDLELNRAWVDSRPSLEAARTRCEALAREPDGADAAAYLLGYAYAVLTSDYETALLHYARVGDRELPFLNNSTGNALLELKRYPEAEPYLRHELQLRANVAGAVSNLVRLYRETHDAAKLLALAEDPAVAPHVPADARALVALHRSGVASYLARTWRFELLERHGAPALLEAALIALMWLVFFWRIDVFEREPIPHSLLVVALGVVAAPLVFPLHALLDLLDPRADSLKDLAFAMLHVGLVEEIVKFLPVALFLLVSRQANEPVDYLIYGSLSALGFATLENADYFSESGTVSPLVVFGRFLACVVGHMFWTSLPCYEWAMARFGRRRRTLPRIAGALLLAAVWHGLYDYFTGHRSELAWLFVIIEAALYGRMLGNALGLSPFFRKEESGSRHLANYELIESAAVITLLVPFALDSMTLTPALAAQRTPLLVLPIALGLVAAVFAAVGELGMSPGQELWLEEPDHGPWQPEDTTHVGETLRVVRASATLFAVTCGLSGLLWEGIGRAERLVDGPRAAWALSSGGVLVEIALVLVSFWGLAVVTQLPRAPHVVPVLAVPAAATPLAAALGRLGFEPTGTRWGLRLSRLTKPKVYLAYLDREQRTFAVLSGKGRTVALHFWSLLEGGGELRTAARVGIDIVPVDPRALLQVFRRAAPEALLQRHLEALAWLAERGLRPRRLTADRFVAELTASIAAHRDAFLRAPIRRRPGIGLRILTFAHHGPVARQRAGRRAAARCAPPPA